MNYKPCHVNHSARTVSIVTANIALKYKENGNKTTTVSNLIDTFADIIIRQLE